MIWPLKLSGTVVPSTSVPLRTSRSRWPLRPPVRVRRPRLLSKFTSTRPSPDRLATVALPPAPVATSSPAPETAPTLMAPPLGRSVRLPAPVTEPTSSCALPPSVRKVRAWPARSMRPVNKRTGSGLLLPPTDSTSALAVSVTTPVMPPPLTGPKTVCTSAALLARRPPSAMGADRRVTTLAVTICSSPPGCTWMPLVPASAVPATPSLAPAFTTVAPLKLLLPLSTATPATAVSPPLPPMLPRRNSWLARRGPPVSCSVLSSCSALSTKPWPASDSMRR